MTQYQPGPHAPHPGMTSPQYPAPMRFPTNPPPPQPPKPKRNPWTSPLAIVMYVTVGILVVLSVAFSGGSDPETSVPASAPASSTRAPKPASEPTEAPTTEAPAGYRPHKSDWKVAVKVKQKQCFGEVGCNVTVTIDPQYVGSQPLPDSGTIEVTYEISGDVAGPVVGTFTVDGGQASYDKETYMSTASSGVKPKAKVTDVTYSD